MVLTITLGALASAYDSSTMKIILWTFTALACVGLVLDFALSGRRVAASAPARASVPAPPLSRQRSPHFGPAMRYAIDTINRTKLGGLLGNVYVEGQKLYNQPLRNEAEYEEWKKAVAEWRSGTEAMIRANMKEWDVADFLDTTNLMSSDIVGRKKFGQEHNDMLLTLDRRLRNLKALREKVERSDSREGPR